ncbi:MAG: hypothetical protein KJ058_09950 [Thermoanaerobaculia bacterium]|nr:hypothetical protein [Thermoanaerobaculia bacterium]MCZ7651652.1 hypothetical protein [Thermoanaerobaculia bacterium]
MRHCGPNHDPSTGAGCATCGLAADSLARPAGALAGRRLVGAAALVFLAPPLGALAGAGLAATSAGAVAGALAGFGAVALAAAPLASRLARRQEDPG